MSYEIRNEYLKLNINGDSKLLIGIGDSFCAGTGSQPIEMWEKYNWDHWKIDFSYEGRKKGYENSFINKICEKYLKDFIPINLGLGGKGNRYAIRELYSNTYLNLDKAKEKIVIFTITSHHRFDFSNDITRLDSYMRTTTLWPFNNNENKYAGYGILETPNGNKIHSEKFAWSEFIYDLFTLLDWCKVNNAKLLMLSNFEPNFDENSLLKILINGNELDKVSFHNAKKMLNKIPWEKVIRPMGYQSISQMLLHMEERDDLIQNVRTELLKYETMGKNQYLTKCLHPSYKGHELLADIIYEKIVEFNYLQNA